MVCIGRHGRYCIQTQVKLGHLRRVASVMYGAAWQTVVGWQQKMAWNNSGIVKKQCCCFLILAVPFLVRFPQKMAVSKLRQTHCRTVGSWLHGVIFIVPWLLPPLDVSILFAKFLRWYVWVLLQKLAKSACIKDTASGSQDVEWGQLRFEPRKSKLQMM